MGARAWCMRAMYGIRFCLQNDACVRIFQLIRHVSRDIHDDSEDGFDDRDYDFNEEELHREVYEMMNSKEYADEVTALTNEMKKKCLQKIEKVPD